MSTLNKISSVLAVIAFIASGIAVSGYHIGGGDSFRVGTAGNLLAENYLPFVMYNGGYSTAKDIVQQTSNSATTTATFGCIQTVATSTASPIVITYTSSFAASTTFPTGLAASQGVVAWKFGTCPSSF